MAEGDLDRAESLYRDASVAFAAQGKASARARRSGTSRRSRPSAATMSRRTRRASASSSSSARTGDNQGLAISLHNLARVKLALGRPEEAAGSTGALEVAGRIGYRR